VAAVHGRPCLRAQDAERTIRSPSAAARAALHQATPGLCFWPDAYLDAADKSNFIPQQQPDGTCRPPVEQYGVSSEHDVRPATLLPFGTPGVASNYDRAKRTLGPRARLARYPRTLNHAQCKVLCPATGCTGVARVGELQPTPAALTAATAADTSPAHRDRCMLVHNPWR
jgi:hypothetical protein